MAAKIQSKSKTLAVIVPVSLAKQLREVADRDGGGPLGPTVRRLLVRALAAERQKAA